MGRKRPKTTPQAEDYDIPTVAKLLGISRAAAYNGAGRLFPVLELDGRRVVPKNGLHAVIDAANEKWRRQREAAERQHDQTTAE